MPCLYLFILTMLYPAAVFGGEFNFLHDHPGKATAPVTISSFPQISKADSVAFKRNLEQLRNLLLKQPVFNPPRGVEVLGYFRPSDTQPTRKVPIPGFGFLRFHFYHLSKAGEPVRICCTTDEIFVSVNDPDQGFDVYGVSGFPSKVIFEPKQVGKLNGFPIYRMDNGDEVLVMTRNGIKPWVPVTREEYLKMWLKFWQDQAAKTALDTLSPQIVKAHQTALNSMSEQQRRMQARHYPGDPREPTLAPVGSDDGSPLVRTNPAWFDPKLPRSAFQLITLRFKYTGNLNHDKPGVDQYGDISPYRVWQALHESNWAEISRALASK